MIINIINDILEYPQVLGVLLLVVCAPLILLRYIKTTLKNKTKISFKEAMELTELPVITFYNHDQKINFLLDTGSNDSHITKSALCNLDHKLLNEYKPIVTMGSTQVDTPCCSMVISNKNHEFEGKFLISDLDAAFKMIKRESGVQIHGILGSRFFQEYKYVLDFDELIAYLK